jgi:radical SAM superfamily enzyme YgiQ (UPF0313 family)
MPFDIILFTETSNLPAWIRGYGAHRLANHLRQKGFSVLVVDFSSYIKFDLWKQICDYAISDSTKLIGFSTTWWPYKIPGGDSPRFAKQATAEAKSVDDPTLIEAAVNGSLRDWITYAKLINPKLKIILGGPKANFYLDIPADHFVIGYGETQVEDLITQPRRIFPKIINHDTEAKSKTFDFKYSHTCYTEYDQIQPYEKLMIEFSRGCRFKCSFCNYPLIGRKDVSNYIKDPDVIYSELMHNYENYGIKDYFVADDTLNDSTEKLEQIVKGIRKLPFQPKFSAYTRLDVMVKSPEHVSLLSEIGLARTWIGLDSLHPIASKKIGKGMSEHLKKEMLYKLQEEWGKTVTIDVGYIVGLPEEPKNFIEKVAEWINEKDNPIYNVEFIALLLVPPSTVLQYSPRSDMDINYEKYGYQIPNMEKFWQWTKQDDTEIYSYDQANSLAVQLNSQKIKKDYLPNMEENAEVYKNPDWYFTGLISKLKKV